MHALVALKNSVWNISIYPFLSWNENSQVAMAPARPASESEGRTLFLLSQADQPHSETQRWASLRSGNGSPGAQRRLLACHQPAGQLAPGPLDLTDIPFTPGKSKAMALMRKCIPN